MSAEMSTVRHVKPGDTVEFTGPYDNRKWFVDSIKQLPTGDIELWVSRLSAGNTHYAVFTMLPDAWIITHGAP